MNQDLNGQFAAWIRAEDGQASEAGDEAFRQLTRNWPRSALPDGIAARIASAATVTRGNVWASRWVRAGVAASLAAVGVALAWQPGGAAGWLILVVFRSVAKLVGRAVWAAHTWLDVAGTLCRSLAVVADVVGSALLAPGPLTAIVLNVVMAALGLAALRRILAAREV